MKKKYLMLGRWDHYIVVAIQMCNLLKKIRRDASDK